MSKHDLIEAIRKLNPTASEPFLLGFDDQALRQYLDRLGLLSKRGTRDSAWVRHGASRSVITRAA